MMPWQGDPNNMIDRFDVRAHLDYIPEYKPPLLTTISSEQESDDRKCNYERYRGLVQNDFAGISEEQCLYQIYIDELYGGLQRPGEDEKKKLSEKKASIGYTYEDSTVAELGESPEKGEDEDSDDESKSDEDEVIPDIDVEVDVDEITEEQVADLNKQATSYGMAEGDFVRMLRKDKEESEAIKHAKALEEEKAMYSGRRSRRQRREFREKRLKGRKISPPSYARRDSPTYDPYRRSQSDSSSVSCSRTPSPGREEAITFITSFGGSDEEASGPATQTTPAGSSSKRAQHTQAPGTSSGRKEASRRRSSSSSSTSSSSTSSSSRTSSRSRSSSRSRRESYRRRSGSRSRSRRYSRSPVRRYSGGGGTRDNRKYSRSRSSDHDRYYGGRRRSRSRSRTPDRYSRGGRNSGRPQGSSQSSLSRTPSPNRERGAGRTVSPALGERLKRPELAVCRESGSAKTKLTPKEKLKLRMQKALNKQYKADKKAAQEKIIQQEHERQEREDELRAMARKIRMKERERRERERDEWERHYTRSRSPSPRHSREYSSSKRRSRSKSRSPHHRH
ncbi:CLK4-associating serine/arginine rich protein isoform X2 [Pseudophryne corroboree]